ncbi:MAG: alpha/beta fold hydrolase [Gammaproteobacteria bacterium]|nr:alpha/beta fold hydrolase [Gammaproteobacteria bacterium]
MFLKRVFGHLISKALIRSQKFSKKKKEEIINEAASVYLDTEFDNVSSKYLQVPSSGNAKITFVECRYLCFDLPQKVIIHIYGRQDCVEKHSRELLQKALYFKAHNITIVGLNLRNVMASTGIPRCQQDWIDDVKAVVDYYVQSGINLNNILLHGHSMGGAIATLAAAQLYKQELIKNKKSKKSKKSKNCIRVLNDRSFSTLPRVTVKLIFGGFGSGLFVGCVFAGLALLILAPFIGVTAIAISYFILFYSLVGGFVCPELMKKLCTGIANVILGVTFGCMNATQAYNSLPEEAKHFFKVKDDKIIGASALAKSLDSCDNLSEANKLVASEMHKSRSAHDLPLYELQVKRDQNKTGEDLYRAVVGRLLSLKS